MSTFVLPSFLYVVGHEAVESGENQVSHKHLWIVVSKVQLGTMSTEMERQVLAQHTENPNQLDPKTTTAEMPEWNADFIRASDRWHGAHIKPGHVRSPYPPPWPLRVDLRQTMWKNRLPTRLRISNDDNLVGCHHLCACKSFFLCLRHNLWSDMAASNAPLARAEGIEPAY